MKRLIQLLMTVTLYLSLNVNATPLDAVQSLSSALHATSLAEILAKIGVGSDGVAKVKCVPTLKVVVDCADCKFGHASRMLMVSSYNDLAVKNGLQLDQAQSVKFVVTNFNSRPSFLRGTLGALSGADDVKGHWEGETETLNDFSISHEMGSDEITQRLGEALLKVVVIKQIKNSEEANIK